MCTRSQSIVCRSDVVEVSRMRRAHRRLGIRGFLLQEVIPLLLGVGSLALYLSVAGRSALVLLTGTI